MLPVALRFYHWLYPHTLWGVPPADHPAAESYEEIWRESNDSATQGGLCAAEEVPSELDESDRG